MFEPLRALIEAHDTIILHRHKNPDGDAIGSQIGLKLLLQENYPEKQVMAVGDGAGRYGFVRESVMDSVEDSAYVNALAIILDVSAPALISDERYTLAAKTARVDHHLFCGTIAETEIIDSSYESCCGLITALAMECNWRMPVLSAEALYTGMVTDSGRFRYDCTSSQTFRLASYLMEQPIDTNTLFSNLYAMDYEQVQLRARFALKIQFTPHHVAYIYTTKEEVAALGGDAFSISRGQVNVMADIKDVYIWVNFTETEQGVLCELRSNRANINPVAVAFGGGGHQKASGATVADRETAMRMLDMLDQWEENGK